VGLPGVLPAHAQLTSRCDLTFGLHTLCVHAQDFAAGAGPLSAQAQEQLIAELEKVRTYYTLLAQAHAARTHAHLSHTSTHYCRKHTLQARIGTFCKPGRMWRRRSRSRISCHYSLALDVAVDTC
jgi:hypothetical protein